MSFFDTYGMPVTLKPSKKLDTRDMLAKNITDQDALLRGEEVMNAKGKVIRSWFRNGRFVPTIGIFGLFDGKVFGYKKGNEAKMLADFKKGFEAGDFDSYIKAVDKKRTDNIKILLDARSKSKKSES